METDALIEYGKAKNPLSEFTEEDFNIADDNVYWLVRGRAWAYGLLVYYDLDGKIVAEYAGGRKMEVEMINGEIVEIGVYSKTVLVLGGEKGEHFHPVEF